MALLPACQLSILKYFPSDCFCSKTSLDLIGRRSSWDVDETCNYTMGVVALLVAGTTAKSLTDSVNRDLEKYKPNQLLVDYACLNHWFLDFGIRCN